MGLSGIEDINALNFRVIRLISLINIDKFAPMQQVTYVTNIFDLEIVEYAGMDRKGDEQNIVSMRL